MESQNPKLVILTGKEHDTPLFRDMQPENVFLRLENCALPKKITRNRLKQKNKDSITVNVLFFIKIKIYNKKIMNISSMLDYIRNPFASKRLSVVVGKSKFLIRKL